MRESSKNKTTYDWDRSMIKQPTHLMWFKYIHERPYFLLDQALTLVILKVKK